MSLSTPVAFIIFNRPDLTKIVFEQIAKAKPKKLFVIADGPRFFEEAEKCQQARKVIDNVDWDCEVSTNFSDINLGCNARLSSGLNWVFSEVEEAIILEDDCLPAPSFFNFCQILLEYYRHDQRIMMISGDNFQLGQSRTNYSYYFSKHFHIWGWASWRRAWQYHDVDMKTWSESKDLIRSLLEDPYQHKFLIDMFELAFKWKCWDWQWAYAGWSQNGLSITPNVNLVSNIGFRLDATSGISDNPWGKLPVTDIWEIKHPPYVVRHKIADSYTFEHHYEVKIMRERNTMIGKIKYKLGSAKQINSAIVSLSQVVKTKLNWLF